MRFKAQAIALGLALGLVATGAGAAGAQAEGQGEQIKVSAQAGKAIKELQDTVKANDFANVPAKLAAANAVAKTPDDKYMIAQLQLQAALAQKDDAALGSAIDAVLATGRGNPAMLARLQLKSGELKYQAKDYEGAATALKAVVAADPNNADALALLADTRNRQQQPAQALELFQRAVAAKKATGQPVPKDWSQRAVALAYNNKLPSAGQLALDWVKADPTPSNWRDAIQIYAETNGIAEADRIDLYRLQRAAGALKGEGDYYKYVNGVSTKGLPAEGFAVMQEGFAANAITKSSPTFSDLTAALTKRAATQRATLAADEKAALADATARPAMFTGDAYLGIGEYAKAAALYRAALGKSGADKDLANLRLGIALARSGDKAGAAAAFNAAGGSRAPIAKVWLTWLGTQA